MQARSSPLLANVSRIAVESRAIAADQAEAKGHVIPEPMHWKDISLGFGDVKAVKVVLELAFVEVGRWVAHGRHGREVTITLL
jgi:hypothetical protein